MRIVVVDVTAEALASLRDQLGPLDAVVGVAAGGVAASLSAPGADVDVVAIVRASWAPEDTELCRTLAPHAHGVPIFAMSGPCEARHRALALGAGADDFLSMPFDRDELAVRAAALLRRAPPQSVRAGALTVEFRGRRVLVFGRPISLTPHEYDLLVALLEGRGEIVSRQELASRIDRDGDGGGKRSNVLDVHMSRLRAKLGPDVCRVVAVRGAGYRLTVT